MPTYSNWTSTTTPISYVPKEKPVYETVGLFTSSTQGIVPPTQNESTNTGQYILAQDGTWIPQPSFSSGGSNAYEILRPAVLGTSYSAYPPTVTNTSYAYDADTNHATTFAEFECASQTRINTITDTLTYSTFASRAQTWTAATINVSRAYGYFDDGESNATTGASNRNTSVTIEYSINNGTNWFTLATDISTSIPSTATSSSAALSTTTPTMANILVKLTLVRGGGGQIYDPDTSANLPGSTGDIDLKIYDIWISGTYTSGAGNITCNDLSVTGDATFSGKIKDGTGSAGTSGYVLSSTGTQTLWVPDSTGSGTVTSITTTGANGVTISGGSTQTITTSGTFALALGAITPTSIATGTGSFSGDVEFAASIKSPTNSPVTIAPDGTGDVHLNTDSVRIGDNNADATLHTRGTGDLIITTHEGSAVEGIVRLYDGANGNITLTPNGSGQVKVGTDQVVTLIASQTLTNKSISGSANTLSNIANASLTNSTISGVALGSNLNALTISSPLTGTSYNGSSAVSIGIPVATTSVNGYLSSADWTTFNNKGSGSVTSVAATVPSLLSISGSPITTSGTLAITYSGTALPVANGGTGLTTLTAGYIPYGAGTSAFASSANLFWDSTNSRLGIGTVSPASALEVRKASGTSTYLQLAQTSIESWQIGMSASSTALAFLNSGTERMRLTDGGSLGIGTASPSEKLSVKSATGINSVTDIASLTNPSQTSAGVRMLFNNGYGNLGAISSFQLDNGAGADNGVLAFQTASDAVLSTKMTILDTGNVGIGTASPSQKLSVSNNIILGTAVSGAGTPAYIDTGLNFSNGTTRDKCKIYLYNSGTEQYGFSVGSSADVQYHSNGIHDFYIANSLALRINSSGNVGIGISTVLANFGGYKTLELNGTTGGLLSLDSNGTNNLQMYTNGSTVNIVTIGALPLTFGTNSTERVRIDSSGNLLVGRTTTPADGLARIAVLNTTDTAIQLTKSGVVSCRITAISTALAFGVDGSDGATERMRIDTTQVKATVPFIGNSGTKGFGGITTTTSTSTPTGGSSGDHYYIY